MVTATDVVPGRYFQIGNPMKGILRVTSADFPMYGKVSIKGEYLDLKTGGIRGKEFSSIRDLVRRMTSPQVAEHTTNAVRRLQEFSSILDLARGITWPLEKY
jgi:hypothetical protein